MTGRIDDDQTMLQLGRDAGNVLDGQDPLVRQPSKVVDGRAEDVIQVARLGNGS